MLSQTRRLVDAAKRLTCQFCDAIFRADVGIDPLASCPLCSCDALTESEVARRIATSSAEVPETSAFVSDQELSASSITGATSGLRLPPTSAFVAEGGRVGFGMNDDTRSVDSLESLESIGSLHSSASQLSRVSVVSHTAFPPPQDVRFVKPLLFLFAVLFTVSFSTYFFP